MTMVTNAFPTYTAKGNREDLVDAIYNIAPSETPGISAIGRGKAQAVLHEWQTDTLATPSTTNFQLEGDEVARAASTATTRLGNVCQIFRKDATVTGTQEVVNKAGRDSEISYQMAKRSKELKTDIEASVFGIAQAKVSGNTTTARKLASWESWIKTNTVRGAGGADPATADGTAIPTDGTQAAFTEAMLKSAMKKAYEAGGSPTMLMVGPHVKTVVSGFTGRTSAQQNIAENKILATASLYASDFGDLKVVPNRIQRGRTAHLIDPEYAQLSYLRSFDSEKLARTGDAETRYIIAETTVEMKNEAAHALVADLLTS